MRLNDETWSLLTKLWRSGYHEPCKVLWPKYPKHHADKKLIATLINERKPKCVYTFAELATFPVIPSP